MSVTALRRRVERMAQTIRQSQPTSVPVIHVTLSSEVLVPTGPYVIESGDKKWIQRPDESLPDLQARASREARETFQSQERFPVLVLVAQPCGVMNVEKTLPHQPEDARDGT